MRRPRKRYESTGGDFIHDESREGYILDRKGRIRGEVKNYDPYSRFGEVMLYDIDSFGFVPGYISIKWKVMSEEDLTVNTKLASRLYETKYQIWKRHNVLDLINRYEKKKDDYPDFERFCREIFRSP